MLILSLVTIACTITLVLNITADPDQEISNSSSIISITPGNLGEDPSSSDLLSQFVIHSVTAVLLGILAIKGFILVKFKAVKYSLYKINAGDYTLMINGLPQDFTNQELREFLGQIDQNLNIVIDSINRTYNINKVIEKSKEIFKMSKGLGKKSRKVAPENEVMMNHLKLEREELIKEAKEMINPVVFVTLNDFLTAKKLLRHHKTSTRWLDWLRFKLKDPSLKRVFRGSHLVSITPTPHPMDVLWENLSTTGTERACSKIITYFCSILLLLTVGLIIMYTKQGINDIEISSNLEIYMKIVLPAIIITVANLLFEWFLGIVTRYEKYFNSTMKKTSLTRKLICLLLINSAIMPLVVNTLNDNDLFTTDGLVNDIFIIVLLNAIMPPMTYYYNIRFAYKWMRQKIVERKLKKSPEYTKIQAELNKIYKPVKINISERYAQIISIMHVSLFFCPIMPIAVPIGLIGIILEYWCTKTMLLRYHSAPKPLNEALGVEMAYLVKLSVVSYLIGTNFFYFWIGGERILILVGIILLSIYLIVPFSAIFYHPHLSKVINEKFKDCVKETEFWKFRLFLHSDFERANPMTSVDAIEAVRKDREEFKVNPKMRIERLAHSFDAIGRTLIKSLDDYITKNYKILKDVKFSRAFYDNFINTDDCRDSSPWYARHLKKMVTREVRKQRYLSHHFLSTYAKLKIIQETPTLLLNEDGFL